MSGILARVHPKIWGSAGMHGFGKASLSFQPASPYRKGSSWQRLEALSSPDLGQILHSPLPLKLPAGSIPIHAVGIWLSASTPCTRLNLLHLRQYGSTLYLPMELTVPGTDTFHRSESAPLSLFLDAWEVEETAAAARSDASTASDTEPSPCIYIAQAPLSLLPSGLAAAFPTPSLLSANQLSSQPSLGGEVYASSLWLGRAPTSTPLHRDPNPNLFVQAAGEKIIRLLEPEVGSALYRRLRDDHGGGSGAGFGADERIRGEEMMKGKEKEVLEQSIWGDKADGIDAETAGTEMEVKGIEARLAPGEALYIPLGWWHAVRGIGEDVNLSVNWWFRPRDG